MKNFNQIISQNIGDNSVIFTVYELDPATGGYGTQTTLNQAFSVDAMGSITMGQPTAFGIATPSISSVPSVAGQYGIPPLDIPFTTTDPNGVSCVSVTVDNQSAVPPVSSVSTWIQPSGFASSVSSSVPVAMPVGTGTGQNIRLIWEMRDRLNRVTSRVEPATTY